VKKNEPDKTRDQVARTILEGGPASAADLAHKLSITPAGIRRHLDSLISEGVLTARDPYLASAVAALKFMASKNGSHLVNEFAQSRANEFERKGSQIKDSNKTISEKAKALAKLLTKEGYAASTDKMGNGEEICQHHCPIAHVASEFPQLCEAETAAFSAILGTHVQRLATIAHGDGVCTTFIPAEVSHKSKNKIKEGAR